MKRFLSNLLACFTQSRSARRHSSPQRRVVLEVECLERREVPSATVSGTWYQEPGTGFSIASGGGQIWSTNADNGTLSRWTGSGWQQVADPHGIDFLAVDQKGNPMVIDGYNDIWRLSGGSSAGASLGRGQRRGRRSQRIDLGCRRRPDQCELQRR